jgi:purine-cytosine permease-like protein
VGEIIGVAKLRFGNKTIALPRSRIVRIGLGVLLIVGGLLGFLPILGFWMIPLGMIVLAEDFPIVRRWNRRAAVAIKRWWKGVKRKPRSNSA